MRRVHRPRFAADSFNRTPAPTHFAGGRFDSLDGSYGYTYLGADDDAAIAETILRDLPFDGTPRILNRHHLLAGRAVTTVRTTRTMDVVSLHGASLAHVGQDTWLTKCDASDYEVTRRWAAWIRAAVPPAAGFEYRCRHDEDRLAWAFFDDGPSGAFPRARAGLGALADSLDLNSPQGARLVQAVAERHNATLDPPPYAGADG